MSSLLVAAVLALPFAGQLERYPAVAHGPVITGVTETTAWVAWTTAHHQGESAFGNDCYLDALTGSPNDTIPTLTLSPAAGATSAFADPACSRWHKVKLTGLAPGTAYTFALDKTFPDGSPAGGGFSTAPSSSQPQDFRFVVYGDNRDEPLTSASTRPDHQALVDAILRDAPQAALLLNVGDLALNLPAVSGDDQGYTEFFDVERPLLATRPFWVALGNHETLDQSFYDGLLSGPRFDGSPHPTWFAVDWGRVHVAFVDAFEGSPDIAQAGARAPLVTDAQAQWLDEDLGAARSAGKILLLVSHQSPYSYGADDKAHGGSPDVKDKIVPLMVKHGARGVFAGHDHYYQHGQDGCVSFLVVGAGGAPMYDPDPNGPGVLAVAKTASYVEMTVEGDRTTGVARDTAGNVLDSFELVPAQCGDGGTTDGGTTDGGSTDAGVVADGSAGADAQGSAPDAAGDSTVKPAGCGCSSIASGFLPALAVAVLLRRRRDYPGCGPGTGARTRAT